MTKKNVTQQKVEVYNNLVPSLSILAQYTKDLSFKSPTPLVSLRKNKEASDINVNINVNANSLSENEFEVELEFKIKATSGEDIRFNVELSYGGLFRLQAIPKDAIQSTILVDCPRLLFPFARQIISDTTRNGGFSPLLIDPVDFENLYRIRTGEQDPSAYETIN